MLYCFRYRNVMWNSGTLGIWSVDFWFCFNFFCVRISSPLNSNLCYRKQYCNTLKKQKIIKLRDFRLQNLNKGMYRLLLLKLMQILDIFFAWNILLFQQDPDHIWIHLWNLIFGYSSQSVKFAERTK